MFCFWVVCRDMGWVIFVIGIICGILVRMLKILVEYFLGIVIVFSIFS